MDANKQAWQKAVEFHGHSCPGLAIGFRMALAATKLLAVQHKSEDEEVVCISETDACGVDAVQALLGCTLGKGNLLLKMRGKSAMSFYVRGSGKAVRLVWIAEAPAGASREEKLRYFLEAPEEEVLKVQAINAEVPAHALISPSLLCARCGELTSEAFVRLREGKPYCLDCITHPSRILE